MKKIKRQAIILLFTLISAIIICSTVSASYPTDIYVSPTGDDTTGDGTQINPYQTIQRGLNKVTDNGSGIIYLSNGTYNKYFDSDDSKDYNITSART